MRASERKREGERGRGRDKLREGEMQGCGHKHINGKEDESEREELERDEVRVEGQIRETKKTEK